MQINEQPAQHHILRKKWKINKKLMKKIERQISINKLMKKWGKKYTIKKRKKMDRSVREEIKRELKSCEIVFKLTENRLRKYLNWIYIT